MEMIITVDKRSAGQELEVTSAYGTFCGRYVGEVPAVGMRRDVELEVPGIFTPSDICLSEDHTCLISPTEEGTMIRGLVAEQEKDMLYLRLGAELIMIALSPMENYPEMTGQYVTLTARAVVLYDTGLIV